MIVQVAPVEKNVSETIASLNFAQRVRSVELGQASRKAESGEVAELKERLAHCEVCVECYEWDVIYICIIPVGK